MNHVKFIRKAVSQRNRRETIFRSGKPEDEERRDETESGKPREEVSPKSDQGKMH